VSEKLTGWRYIGDYEGQNPAYAELDDSPHPVKVRIFGRNNERKAVNKAGDVVFIYNVYPENLNWHLKEKR
jgi:hypothetical protein